MERSLFSPTLLGGRGKPKQGCWNFSLLSLSLNDWFSAQFADEGFHSKLKILFMFKPCKLGKMPWSSLQFIHCSIIYLSTVQSFNTLLSFCFALWSMWHKFMLDNYSSDTRLFPSSAMRQCYVGPSDSRLDTITTHDTLHSKLKWNKYCTNIQ